VTADPANLLAHSRRRTRYVAAGCGVAMLGAMAWALMPTHPAVSEAPRLEMANAAADSPPPAPLDVKAFETPVWTIAAAPQPAAPPPPPPPAPPPLKLQLIGIIREAEVYKAVIYDPDTNKLFVVASGEAAAGHTVERVVADSITIKDGALVRTLALKTGGGA
jgi:hypothetical protein